MVLPIPIRRLGPIVAPRDFTTNAGFNLSADAQALSQSFYAPRNPGRQDILTPKGFLLFYDLYEK